jgi:hypothetical protein
MEKRLGKIGNGFREIAINAVKNISRLILLAPSSALVVARLTRNASEKESQLVFDLTVEKNACYQVNGLMVSNCDAWGATAEVIDQIVNDIDSGQGPALAAFVNSDPTMGLLG